MTISIDISQIVYKGTGTATYYKNLVTCLPKIDSKNDYIFFGSSFRQMFKLHQYTKNVWPFPPLALDFLWNRLHIFPVENLIGNIDIFHSSDWTQPPTKAKKVAPIFDMVVYKFPESSHPQIIATQKRRLEWVKREANMIITISESAKKDIVEILGIPVEKIKVIYLAAGAEFKPQTAEQINIIRNKYHLEEDYYLAVGTREPRKNLQRIITAAQKINTTLVIAGKFGWGAKEVGSDPKKIHPLGYVPQEDLPALYAGAKCFVYPSLYEGFGVPIIEAMACGCPVITSNVGSMPEVGGNAALYVNPESVDDIADKMQGVTRRLVNMGYLQAKNFSWEKTARETLSVYEKLAGN